MCPSLLRLVQVALGCATTAPTSWGPTTIISPMVSAPIRRVVVLETRRQASFILAVQPFKNQPLENQPLENQPLENQPLEKVEPKS